MRIVAIEGEYVACLLTKQQCALIAARFAGSRLQFRDEANTRYPGIGVEDNCAEEFSIQSLYSMPHDIATEAIKCK